jgi:hypothetical protein
VNGTGSIREMKEEIKSVREKIFLNLNENNPLSIRLLISKGKFLPHRLT